MSRIRVEISIKNAALYNALESRFANLCKLVHGRRLGFLSLAAREIGINHNSLFRLVGLKDKPTKKKNTQWTSTAIKIAKFLELPPESIFPPDLYGFDVSRFAIESDSDVLLPLAAAKRLLIESPDSSLPPLSEALTKLFCKLTPKQEKILRMRFGMHDDFNGEQSLRECADEFGCTPENIRRIESKAMAVLRNHHRALKDYPRA